MTKRVQFIKVDILITKERQAVNINDSFLRALLQVRFHNIIAKLNLPLPPI